MTKERQQHQHNLLTGHSTITHLPRATWVSYVCPVHRGLSRYRSDEGPCSRGSSRTGWPKQGTDAVGQDGSPQTSGLFSISTQ